MLWIKNHQLLSLLLFSSVVFCLFFLLVPSSSCSAASQSFTYDSSTYPGYSLFSSTEVGFTPSYVTIEVVGSSKSNTYVTVLNVPNGNNNTSNTVAVGSDGYIFSSVYLPEHYVYTYSSSTYGTFTSLTLTFYDSVPVPVPCPDCPEIPDTPYGDILDKIYHAILIGSATLLVIYFFFAIYSMFFGGLKK